MGNSISCCTKRKNYEEKIILSKKELKNLLIKTSKKLSKDEILLKINKLRSSRNGDILFSVLMGTSAIITLVVITSSGAVEPNLVNGLIIGVGATGHYISEAYEKDKIIDIYKEILRNK